MIPPVSPCLLVSLSPCLRRHRLRPKRDRRRDRGKDGGDGEQHPAQESCSAISGSISAALPAWNIWQPAFGEGSVEFDPPFPGVGWCPVGDVLVHVGQVFVRHELGLLRLRHQSKRLQAKSARRQSGWQ